MDKQTDKESLNILPIELAKGGKERKTKKKAQQKKPGNNSGLVRGLVLVFVLLLSVCRHEVDWVSLYG